MTRAQLLVWAAAGAALLWGAVASGEPLGGYEYYYPLGPVAPHSSYPAYLDAVRAQRQALMEQHRRELQEAVEARRKRIDPWGEAQREALRNGMEERRRSLDERVEQRRELLDRARWESLSPYYYAPEYRWPGVPWFYQDIPLEGY